MELDISDRENERVEGFNVVLSDLLLYMTVDVTSAVLVHTEAGF